MFHAKDGLFFCRNVDGSVRLVQTTDCSHPKDGGKAGNVAWEITLDAGTWTSAVLSMTKHGERPGDFHAMNDHHQGRTDLLEGKRGGY